MDPVPAVEMIQPIAVLKDPDDPAGHEETCLAAALASAAALSAFPDDEHWEPWYASGQGKSVRRGKPKDLRAVTAQGAVVVEVGRAVAAAMAPTTYPLVGRMKQLQVAGTELEHTGEPVEHSLPAATGVPVLHLGVDTSLGMSTGKAAAQSAHAALEWAVRLRPEQRSAWMQAGQPAVLTPLDAKGMRRGRRRASVEIHDAGHTEIAAGSMTALAR
jgi:peptidyl-tRNA hydrolase